MLQLDHSSVMELEITKSITMCASNQEDLLVWHFEPSGVFRCAWRTCYSFREAWPQGEPPTSTTEAEGKSWTKLWEFLVKSKV